MATEPGAAEFLPAGRPSLDELARAAGRCRGCPLWRDACQTVFGEGPATAEIVLVGEQPGDREDQAGRPFVGPAGRELDHALDEIGLERDRVYVTNAVKHFKFHRAGKRRLHDKPNRHEVVACSPWLEAELDAIQPEAVVALGATAARQLFGPDFRVTRQHGELIEDGPASLSAGTIHPSAILRTRGDPDELRRQLRSDLAGVIALMS